MPISFKPQIEWGGQWVSTRMRFATLGEAEASALDFSTRFACGGHRGLPSEDRVNCLFYDDNHIWLSDADASALAAAA